MSLSLLLSLSLLVELLLAHLFNHELDIIAGCALADAVEKNDVGVANMAQDAKLVEEGDAALN